MISRTNSRDKRSSSFGFLFLFRLYVAHLFLSFVVVALQVFRKRQEEKKKEKTVEKKKAKKLAEETGEKVFFAFS